MKKDDNSIYKCPKQKTHSDEMEKCMKSNKFIYSLDESGHE